jgi:uncharacterized C2H2 Zn-finger protein
MKRLGLVNTRQEEQAVKCDICDQEFPNSIELERHVERAHPANEGEKPDFMEENPESEASEPEPSENLVRN